MKATIIAISALFCATACNRGEKSEARSEAREAAREVREEAKDAHEEAREGTGKFADKVGEEARQTARDVGEGLDKSAHKVKEESRQTARDVGEALDGDSGKTPADKRMTESVRNALKADRQMANEARTIHIRTEDGVVNLWGTVSTSDAKREIGAIASDASGTTAIDNDLEVVERTGSVGQ